MYKTTRAKSTTIKLNQGYKGETIENKVARITQNKEPIKDGAPIIYTERKDGVNPAHDIRTDRFEVAVDAMDYITKSHLAKREGRIKDAQAKKEGFKNHAEKEQAAANAKKEQNNQSPTDNK